MNPDQRRLYQQIEEFALDDPQAQYPFSARLASENNWSPEYTQRVLKEYKRFVFLAVVAGHPVTPADAVDQAWHLHLTYTRSYWDQFCAEVLQTKLHHQPTAGGSAEKEKFSDQYEQTLSSYLQFFGQKPPRDIWPPASIRFAENAVYRRVDTRDNWIISKWPFRGFCSCIILGLICLAPYLLLYLISTLGNGSMTGEARPPRSKPKAQEVSPLTPEDRQTVLVFSAAALIGLVLATSLQRRFRQAVQEPPPEMPHQALEMDPYEIAYLAGGREKVLQAGVAVLVCRQLLQVATSGEKLEHGPATIAGTKLHPVEQSIWEGVDPKTGTHPQQLVTRFKLPPKFTDLLEALGLVLPAHRARWGRWLPLLVAYLVPLAGILYLMFMKEPTQLTGLVFVLWLVAVGLAWELVGQPLHRTIRGDESLHQLRGMLSDLKTTFRNEGEVPSTTEMIQLVGLFGLGVLAGTPWSSLHTLWQPTRVDVGYVASCDSDGDAGCGGGGCGCG